MFAARPAGSASVERLPRRRLRAFVAALSLAMGSTARAQTGPADGETATAPAQRLDAVNVSDTRYKPVPIDLPKWSLAFGLDPFPIPTIEPTVLGPVVVTASRSSQALSRVSVSARVLDTATLQATPAATLDSVLRTVPGFSLFRRSDSLTAHPTAQGVSLRGVGPSGASRTLVLLDGVPLNDPFGGWVNWAKVPRDALARVEVVSGGGASAWGNAALGGAVQLFSVAPRTELVIIDRPPAPIAWGSRGTLAFGALAGAFQTRGIDFVATRPLAHGTLQIVADDFTTAGFPIIASERRGPIDVPAWSRHGSLTARWRRALSKTIELTATIRRFEEFRGNGTPYQRNGTRDTFASIQVFGQPSDAAYWKLIGYAQRESFSSTFSSVRADRAAETPASNQFDVPATALGASWTGTWMEADTATTTVGADVRSAHGESRENYSYQNGDFTRERVAGGTQLLAGVFGSYARWIVPGLRANAGARLDAWTDRNGHRHETDRATHGSLRDEQYASARGTEFSPTAGLLWSLTPTWRIRANAQHAFRRPTLNELYRPFRQGTNVVEANAMLRTERITSAEIGTECTLLRKPTPAPPATPVTRSSAIQLALAGHRVTTKPLLTLGATAFWNELHDAVGNVTLVRGPGTFPVFGSLPAGTVGRERLNLDQTRIEGAELSASWLPSDAFGLQANYLYTDAVVRRAAVAPALVGKGLAEVPRHAASLTATLKPHARLTLAPRLRWIGRQFDDDENTLRLGEAVVADVGVTFALNKNIDLFLNAENIGDARIETARTADGVVSTGTPRFVFGGFRGRW